MKDSDFKNLHHQVGNLVIATRGTEISQGYKPDITVTDSNATLQYILECEQKTDRKAFLGDVLKAQKHSEQCNASPALIIVMREFKNTTVRQIADHIQNYVQWLNRRLNGGLALSRIAVMADSEYLHSVRAQEILGSVQFMQRAVEVQK